MSRRGLLIASIVVALIGAFAAWWLYTYKRVPMEIDLPPRGEARYNPLFALKRSLQAQGVEVATTANAAIDATVLKPGEVMVLYSDVRTLAESTSTALLEWVDRGGHLVFALPSAEGQPGALLDTLGLYVSHHRRCLKWQFDNNGKVEKASHCFSYRFDSYEDDLTETFEWLWGNVDDGYLFGRQYRGEGSVFIAGELDFLDNGELNKAGHAELAWQVLAPVLGKGRVHLIYAADVPPLYVLILRHGWPILLPVFIALLAWLWARSQRFGPLLPLASAHRRALLEHVQASGEFVFRRGRTMALYAAVHRLFMARLRRRHPAVAALDGDALVQALSTLVQMPATAIRQALTPVDLARPDQFIATIKTLMQLRARL
jgi:hypothetical protein